MISEEPRTDKPTYRFSGELPAALAPLQARAQWVCWDYVWNKAKEKWDKPPLSAKTGRKTKGGAQHPDNWGSYEQACATATRKSLAGVGYVITEDDGITGIDIDHCITDAGTYSEAAAQVLDLGETYAEVSPSGEGVRLFCLGKYGGGVIKKDAVGVEVYTKLRYLTVTGNQVDGSPSELRPAPQTLEYLARVAGVDEPRDEQPAGSPLPRNAPLPSAAGDYFGEVNRRALANLDAWVRQLHPRAKRQATGAWRVSSKDLGRKLEEDLAYHPHGIRDHGEEHGLTPIDAVMRFGGQSTAVDAAIWLCHRLGVEPTALGFRAGARPKATPASSTPQAPQGDAAKPPAQLVLSFTEFMARHVRPRYLVDGILQKGFLYSLTGNTGDGKTAIGLLMAMSVVLGTTFGPHEVERGRVIYIAKENADDVRNRLIGMVWVSVITRDAIDRDFLVIEDLASLEGDLARVTAEAEAFGPTDLVVVDTSAAVFPGDDENSNPQALAHAKVMRRYTKLPGNPTVLVLCHPPKGADTKERLLPRGGGAFLNEMDGNLTAHKSGDKTSNLHWAGKLRGPDFEEIIFRFKTIKTPDLADHKGRIIPTVTAQLVTDEEAAEEATKSDRQEAELLVAMLEAPDGSIAKWAEACGWFSTSAKTGKRAPWKGTGHRVLTRLCEAKLARKRGRNYVLTNDGIDVARSTQLERRSRLERKAERSAERNDENPS